MGASGEGWNCVFRGICIRKYAEKLHVLVGFQQNWRRGQKKSVKSMLTRTAARRLSHDAMREQLMTWERLLKSEKNVTNKLTSFTVNCGFSQSVDKEYLCERCGQWMMVKASL